MTVNDIGPTDWPAETVTVSNEMPPGAILPELDVPPSAL